MPYAALGMWQLFIPPAMAARPSALSRVPPGESPSGPATKTASEFGEKGFKLWLEFQEERGKKVSKDTWSLFIDFVRTIDAEYKEYDETGEWSRSRLGKDQELTTAAWPSTIDEFVEYARERV